MKKVVFSILGVAVLLLLAQAEVLACTCFSPDANAPLKTRVKSALDEARAVFSGSVLEVSENSKNRSVTVKLRVERFWKGALGREIRIVTGRGGGDCGYNFEVGVKYLVYAYGPNESSLGTNICQRTARLAAASNDVKVLGRGKIPVRRKT